MSSSASPRPFRVGLLGHGTVGGAFAPLLEQRADEIERMNGRRPVISRRADALARRLRRDPRGLGAARRADRRHRTGARVRAARRCAPGATSSAPTSSCSPSTARSSSRPPANTMSAALRGRRRRRRPRRAGARGVARRRRRSSASTGSSTARPTSSSPRWRAGSTYAEALAEAQRLGYAEADPSDDVSGRDAAAKMAILARLAFGTPVHLDDVRYEGIEHLTTDDLQYARELGLG